MAAGPGSKGHWFGDTCGEREALSPRLPPSIDVVASVLTPTAFGPALSIPGCQDTRAACIGHTGFHLGGHDPEEVKEGIERLWCWIQSETEPTHGQRCMCFQIDGHLSHFAKAPMHQAADIAGWGGECPMLSPLHSRCVLAFSGCCSSDLLSKCIFSLPGLFSPWVPSSW